MKDQLEFKVEQQALAYLVQRWDKKYTKIVNLIDPEYLQAEPYRWYSKKFVEFIHDHTGAPPWDYIDVQICREFSDEETCNEVRNVIYLLYSMELTWGETALQDFREYLAWRVYSAGVRAVQDGFRRSRHMGVALDHGQRALSTAKSLLCDARVHDLAEDFEEREAAWIRERDMPGSKIRVSLGIPELEEYVCAEEGTTSAFLAPSGRGKSILLNHVGVCSLALGYNVFHATGENSTDLTKDRYFARLMCIDKNDLTRMRADPTRYAQARAFVQGLKTHLDNRLKIMKIDPKRTSVADVESYLEILRLEEGFVPEVTIWDYVNIMAPNKGQEFKEERLSQEAVIWNLKDHADDAKNGGAHPKVVWTAMQTKGESIKKKHLDAGDYGKAVGILQALDNCIGINQTKQEAIDGELRLGNLKARDAAASDEVTLKCELSWMCADLRTWGWVQERITNLFVNKLPTNQGLQL